ncbi:MAG: hypothetical protein ABIR18_06005 [Chitinophagaceae bacterium]
MKLCLTLLFSLLLGSACEGQILKDLGRKAKEEVEYRVRRKAGQKIDEGLDKVLDLPKKIKINKKGNEPGTDNPNTSNSEKETKKGKKENKKTSGSSLDAKEDDDLVAKDGFITLNLSATTVFTGTAIRFTGESIKHKQYSNVEITITGPSTKDVRTISLSEDGKYIMDWTATENIGDFTVMVKSSDKKAQKNEAFTVEGIEWMDNWGDDNIEETKKAFDHLEEQVDKVKEDISAKDKAELGKKMSDVKAKVDDLLKLFKDLNTAGKATADIAKKGKKMPPSLKQNLSELGNTLSGHARQMKEFNRVANHEPFEENICEYLVMVNEACAAFSTITNVATLNIWGIVKNIAVDKVVPKAVGTTNEAAGGVEAPYDFPLKEATKIYATSKIDAESLVSKMGKAGITGDLVQFATDVLLKIYCGTFSGEITHDYTINFRNSNGETWWKYGVKMKGALSLRYPKKGAEAGIIKMKGSIEGNAINFTFYQNVAVEESFKEGTKEKIEVVELKVLKPPAVPFVSSQVDKFGFGAAARTLVTPASFFIRIDAEYDPDDNKIKLFINPALIDFTPLIKNTFIFLLVGADLLPYIKKMDFPIHPAQLTIKGSLNKDNEFTVDKDKSNNLSIVAKRNRHIGSPKDKIETDLNFYISAKKD